MVQGPPGARLEQTAPCGWPWTHPFPPGLSLSCTIRTWAWSQGSPCSPVLSLYKKQANPIPMSPSRFRSIQHLYNMWAAGAPTGDSFQLCEEQHCLKGLSNTRHLPGTKVSPPPWNHYFPAALVPKRYQRSLKTREKNKNKQQQKKQAWEQQAPKQLEAKIKLEKTFSSGNLGAE